MKQLFLAASLLVPVAAYAQAPVWLSTPQGQPYNAANPLPVTGMGGGGGSSTPTTPNGTATTSSVPVADGATGGSVALASKQPGLNGDGGELAHVTNFPTTQAVTGTFYQTTQPVSGTVAVSSLPAIPTGSNAIGSVSVSNFPGSQAVTGTFYQATQPVSASTLPLPSGASTAALQSAINADNGSQVHVMNFPTTQTVAGNVGGYTGQASSSPTVSTSAYSSGQTVGGLQTLTGVVRSGQTTGMVQKVLVSFADAQTPALDEFIFNASPTGSTTTNQTAFALATADISKVVGVVHISDCTPAGTPTVCQAQNLSMSYAGAASGGSLYAVLVTRAALTLASTTDMTIIATGPQD